MSKLFDKIQSWKPISEFFTGILGVLISCLALVISIYAVYTSSSSPEVSSHPGRHFGVAILRGNHLPDWDMPYYEYPHDERWLVIDMAVVIANGGGRRSVVDHLELSVTRESDKKSITMDWVLFFIEPTSRDLKKRPELVTPIVIEGSSSQKKLVRFAAPSKPGDLPGFFVAGESYEISLSLHRAESDSPIESLELSYAVTWKPDEDDIYNIQRRDYGPDATPKTGETALLTFY